MENTIVAFDIFKMLEGSYKGEIRLKNISMNKVRQYHSELEQRGERVPNYLMKAEGQDVGTGKTNAT